MNQNTTKINWFPGHMSKALNEMKQESNNVDMIIYILDSRAPKSSVNPEFIAFIKDKPVLYILNKADLVDESELAVFEKQFKTNTSEVLKLNSVNNGAIRQVEPIMKRLCKAKIEKYQNKGIKTNLRAMVVGVPNSGKSTFINNLCGVKKAITGDQAGVTKGRQWVSLKNGFEICDTPGTLWPNQVNQTIAKNLAFIGSIKNEILDTNDLSAELLKFLIKYYPNNLVEKYKISDLQNKSVPEIFDEITTNKHYLLKGGAPDYDRCAIAILEDFRKGRLGKIILDK